MTYNLELDGHDSEVEHLHQRPDHIVRLERGNVDFLELGPDCSLATTLCDCHEAEEGRQTYHTTLAHPFHNILLVYTNHTAQKSTDP